MNLQTLVCYKNYYDSMYVVTRKMSYQLRVINYQVNNTYDILTYYDEDYANVYYGNHGEVLVFICKHGKGLVGE